MSNRILDLTKPSLAGLSYLLRQKEMWPGGFIWDYQCTDTCAMALAEAQWPEDIDLAFGHAMHCLREMMRVFDMTEADAANIFCGGNWTPWKMLCGLIPTGAIDRSKVTPAMVADQIDKYLVNKSIVEPALAV